MSGNYYCPGCGHQFFDRKTGTDQNLPADKECEYCVEEKREEVPRKKRSEYRDYRPDSDENYAW